MKRVLLTGATGFLGSYILEALVEKGHQVTILKRTTSKTCRIEHLLAQVKAVDIDIRPLEDAFKYEQIDVVIHTACNYGRGGQSAYEIAETNLIFALRVLDAATSFNTSTFINTDTLLPAGLNAYSLSKRQFAEWLKQRSSKIQIVNMKLEHMYGPRDDETKFVPWLISQLRNNVSRIPLTEGSQMRDFVYIKDVLNAYMLALAKLDTLTEFTEFDVGSGELITVRDFVTALQRNFQKLNPANQTILGFGDLPFRAGEMMAVHIDTSSLRRLGWKPKTSLDQGLLKMCGGKL